jgi:hypothetical protein
MAIEDGRRKLDRKLGLCYVDGENDEDRILRWILYGMRYGDC